MISLAVAVQSHGAGGGKGGDDELFRYRMCCSTHVARTTIAICKTIRYSSTCSKQSIKHHAANTRNNFAEGTILVFRPPLARVFCLNSLFNYIF